MIECTGRHIWSWKRFCLMFIIRHVLLVCCPATILINITFYFNVHKCHLVQDVAAGWEHSFVDSKVPIPQKVKLNQFLLVIQNYQNGQQNHVFEMLQNLVKRRVGLMHPERNPMPQHGDTLPLRKWESPCIVGPPCMRFQCFPRVSAAPVPVHGEFELKLG